MISSPASPPRRPHRWLASCLACVCLVGACLVGVSGAQTPTPADLEFFESKIRPLLVEHCYECHSGDADPIQAGIRVDSRAGLLRGGDSGPAIVPGQTDESLLLEAVRYETFEMPPRGKLPDAEIELLQRWVAMGAPWPDEAEPDGDPGREPGGFDLQGRTDSHWCWQPIRDPRPPQVTDETWPRDDADRFILAKLESAGLSPAASADRRSLIRRLYFDLIGLPPSPDDMARWMAGDAEQALDELTDQLLASEHFGERWGRHWLDLVRYAESRGHEFDEDAFHAHEYRDYVIRAFNADLPYDRFVEEQIAGDLLSEPRRHPESGFDESVLGTGFWFLGEWVHSPVDVRKDEAERFDNMIDVMSKTFLGLTVACARCHDHKFDAISTADYYSLTGFLQSSDYRQARFESELANRELAEELWESDREAERRLRSAIAADIRNRFGDGGESGPSPADQEPFAEVPRSSAQDSGIAERVLFDYGHRGPDSPPFMQDGVTFGPEPRRVGQLVLDASTDPPSLSVVTAAGAINDPFWHGLRSQYAPVTNRRGRLETLPRSGRTLRSPTFELTEPIVSCEVRGGGHIVACVDSHRLVAGPLHGETVVRVDRPDDGPDGATHWVTLRLARYVGHRMHLEFTPDEDATLEIRRVISGSPPTRGQGNWQAGQGEPGQQGETGQQDETGQGEAAAPATAGEAPADAETIDRARANRLRIAAEWWEAGRLPEHPRAAELAAELDAFLRRDTAWREATIAPHAPHAPRAPRAPRETGETGETRETGDLKEALDPGETVAIGIERWARRRADLAGRRRLESRLAMAMLDGSGENGRVLIRGNAANPGREVPRRFLSAIDGEGPLWEGPGSGRLALARRIVADDNPLSDRVIVNRIWHQLMGRGIVPTPDDFGVLGQPPSHPELLDHLATRFRREGRSVKQMIRMLVRSATYRMSAHRSPDAHAVDPNNVWRHHFPPKRLEAEAIRDALLAVSGKLDRTPYGPPVPIHLTPFMDGRGRPGHSGPRDGDGRRSIYVAVRRNFISPFMMTFDMPVPFSTMGRRNVSNVPAQALILMNDPFVLDCAQAWGRRSVTDGPADPEARIAHMYETAFARPPSEFEAATAAEFVRREAAQRGTDPSDPDVWADLAHALINTKEFIYLR